MKLSDAITELQDRLRREGDFVLTPDAEVNITARSINPQYYIDQALEEASRIEETLSAPVKDYVREYGVLVGKSRVRHFIDKSSGGATLCGLKCGQAEGASIDAERTCAECAERQSALRSK